MYTLTGYALVLGNFGKRKVVVIIKIDKITLFRSKHITVEIKQNRYFNIICQNYHSLKKKSL